MFSQSISYQKEKLIKFLAAVLFDRPNFDWSIGDNQTWRG